MKTRLLILVSILGVLFIVGCNKSKFPGYEEHESGLYYKIHVENEDAPKAKEGDYVYVNMIYRIEDEELDTLLFDSKQSPQPIILKVSPSLYVGDINNAFSIIGLGDSATFITSADSFFMKTAGLKELPPPVKPGMMLYFDIKVNDIKTEAEFEQEMQLQMAEQQKQLEGLKEQEAVDRESYLKENNITVKPTQTGLYFIPKEKGTGKQAQNGKTVKVEYEGRFLNGVVFDGSAQHGEPIEFVLGEGQVIPGWEEGLLMMKEGGKAQLIIPSDLAYGQSQPNYPIPPYATLVFDVELVEVSE